MDENKKPNMDTSQVKESNTDDKKDDVSKLVQLGFTGAKKIPIKLDINSDYTSQSEALLQLCMGNNVFLSGPAGSGKSYIIRKYCDLVREIRPSVSVYRTSTTGLSALNIHGDTIHSYTGQGVSSRPYEELKDNHESFLALWLKSKRKIQQTDILIIDEISMFSEAALRFLRDRMEALIPNKLNKIQIIVAGDFSQLAPVAKKEQIEMYGPSMGNYCYKTSAWNEFNFVTCYLDKIYRTNDFRLQNILAAIADGQGNNFEIQEAIKQINQKKSSHIPGVPTLLPTNREVRNTNIHWQELNKGQEYYNYTIIDKDGDEQIARRMANERDVKYELRLRVGDTIMITSNASASAPYFDVPIGQKIGPLLKNGMIGEFAGVVVKGKEITKNIDDMPVELHLLNQLIFKYKDGDETFTYYLNINHETIMNAHDKVIAGFFQYPVKLAYAISIHKSQGQTFSKIAVDLHRCWRPGLGYVALSRATSLDGITIINATPWQNPWNNQALKIDERSLAIRRDILNESQHVRHKFAPYYKYVGNDVGFFIANRSRLNLYQLMRAAYDNKNNQLKKFDYYEKLKLQKN